MGQQTDKTGPEGRNSEIGRRDLFRLLFPHDGRISFGRIEISTDRCSLCGLCARVCQTGAMKVKTDQKTELMFDRGECDACGRCSEVCPEECLRIERALGVEGERAWPVVLIEDKVVRCSVCGAEVGSSRMIERLRAKLTGTTDLERAAGRHSELFLCQTCKVRQNLAGDRGSGHSA